MKLRFIEQHWHQFLIVRMCAMLGVSPSGYHAFRRCGSSRRARENHLLLVHIRAIYRASQETYGYRRVYHELRE